ncbi:MAG TPA: DUF2202 domain-containing protein [Deltaproteobacteria bacterium]|nr:DUF2202 domain-containing protein [Deltaproteobacteria bacterium]
MVTAAARAREDAVVADGCQGRIGSRYDTKGGRMRSEQDKGIKARAAAIGILFVMALGSSGTLRAAALSEEEIADLVFIREEEKLARDVYLTLSDTWGTGIFAIIASSEQTHMDAVKTLLDRYGIPDPAAGMGMGDFSDESGLKDYYIYLVDLGTESLIGAMEAGFIIEEMDIEDLREALSRTTHRDVSRVYTNLLRGSYSHLAAFTYQLERLGVTLEP